MRETSDLLELIRRWGGEATVGKLQEASRKFRDGVGKTALDGLVREGHGRWDGHIFRLGA